MGLRQDRQLCLRLCVRRRRRAPGRAGRGRAGLVSLQWRQISASASSSGARGRGGTEGCLGRRRAVHLRAQRAECIQREVRWLLGKTHKDSVLVLASILTHNIIIHLCACMRVLSNLRDSCLRVGLAHVDVHSVSIGGKLLHKRRLICRLRHHVPAVRSHHALRRGHPRG